MKSIENREGTSTPKIDGLDLSVISVLLRIVLVDSIFFPIIEELVETEVAGSGSKCSEVTAEFTAGSEVTADSGSEVTADSGSEVTADSGWEDSEVTADSGWEDSEVTADSGWEDSEVTADSGSEFNKEMRLSILDGSGIAPGLEKVFGGGLAPGLEKVFGAKELVPVIMVVLLLLFNPIFTWLIVS